MDHHFRIIYVVFMRCVDTSCPDTYGHVAPSISELLIVRMNSVRKEEEY